MIPNIKDLEAKMAKCVEATQRHFMTVRTGKASPALLDGIRAEYYGALVPLAQVGTVSAPEGRLLEVRAWDPTALVAIEKAISKSDLGLNPTNDGKVIRIVIPALTEERRKDLTKVVKKLAEEGRVAVRTVRHDAVRALDQAKAAKEASEDDVKKLRDQIQRSTDRFIAEVDALLANKEKEILEV